MKRPRSHAQPSPTQSSTGTSTGSVGNLRDLLMGHPDVRAYVGQLVTFAAERLRTDASTLRNDGPVLCDFILDGPEGPTTVAASDALVEQLGEIEYDVDGPALQALRSGEHVLVGDVESQTQWPTYREAVKPLGIRSVMSIPLPLTRDVKAAMNFYSTSPDAFDDMTVDSSTALAEQAGHALLLAARMTDDGHRAKELHDVLQTRTTTDLAVGIVMGRRGCGQEAAFEVLRSEAANRNVTLDEVAADLVTSTGNGPPRVHLEP